LEEWFAKRGEAAIAVRWQERQRLAESRMELVRATREKLAVLYATAQPAMQMKAAKAALFTELKDALAAASADPSAWEAENLNNAWLVTLSLYRGYLPAFRKLFENCAAEWPCFYAAVDALGELPAATRAQSLAELTAS